MFSGVIQNIVVITGDQSVMVLILVIAIWTCYWLWRIGRDIVGKGLGGCWFIAMSFVIDVTLLYMLQTAFLNFWIVNTNSLVHERVRLDQPHFDQRLQVRSSLSGCHFPVPTRARVPAMLRLMM